MCKPGFTRDGTSCAGEVLCIFWNEPNFGQDLSLCLCYVFSSLQISMNVR